MNTCPTCHTIYNMHLWFIQDNVVCDIEPVIYCVSILTYPLPLQQMVLIWDFWMIYIWYNCSMFFLTVLYCYVHSFNILLWCVCAGDIPWKLNSRFLSVLHYHVWCSESFCQKGYFLDFFPLWESKPVFDPPHLKISRRSTCTNGSLVFSIFATVCSNFNCWNL